jgi:hypothetical protein
MAFIIAKTSNIVRSFINDKLLEIVKEIIRDSKSQT